MRPTCGLCWTTLLIDFAALAHIVAGNAAWNSSAGEPTARTAVSRLQVVQSDCPGLDGNYISDDATTALSPNWTCTISTSTLNSSIVFGFCGEGRQGFSGTLQGNCFGRVVFPLSGEYLFWFSRNCLNWNSGVRWIKTGIQDSSTEVDHAHVIGEEVGYEKVDEETEDFQRRKVSVAVATMLFGMFAAGVGMLYLLNSSDEDIKPISYNIVSVTLSIFIAVLLNQAIFTFLVDQLLEGHYPKIIGLPKDYRIHSLAGILVFSVLWVLTLVACWRFSGEDGTTTQKEQLVDGHQRIHPNLEASSQLGGHLCAFAGIYAANPALRAGRHKLKGTYGLTICVVIGAALLLAALWLVSRQVLRRLKIITRNRAFEEKTFEAYQDAVVLTMSYLVQQFVCQITLGKLPQLHGKQPKMTWHAVRTMSHVTLLYLVFLAGHGILTSKRLCPKVASWLPHPKLPQHFLALCLSWSVHLGGSWGMQVLFSRTSEFTSELVDVINALVMSFVSVIIILLLDYVADNLAGKGQRTSSIMSGNEVLPSQGEAMDVQPAHTVSSTHTPYQRVCSVNSANVSIILETHDLVNILRRFIHSAGLLIALSWDKAFDASEETIVEGLNYLGEKTGVGKHEVIAKVTLAIALVMFVAPAWKWYVVPAAMEHEHASKGHDDDHQCEPGWCALEPDSSIESESA